MTAPPRIPVVGAVIVRDGVVLCARRGADAHLAGRWEFPGGKAPGDLAGMDWAPADLATVEALTARR